MFGNILLFLIVQVSIFSPQDTGKSPLSCAGSLEWTDSNRSIGIEGMKIYLFNVHRGNHRTMVILQPGDIRMFINNSLS